MKIRIVFIILVALAIVLSVPAPVLACDGILCLGTFFNSTERVKLRTERDAEIARVRAQADTEQARIEGEATARVEEAKAQLQREVEAGKLAQAQADAQARQFVAMVEAQRDQKLAEIQLSYEKAAAMIESQSEVAIAGITETGITERWRVTFDGITAILAVLIIGGLIAGFMWWHRPAAMPARPVIMIQTGNRPPIAAKYNYLDADYQQVEYPMERHQ